MLTEPEVIQFIEAEADRLGITPSTFCNYACKDGGLYGRLKDGATVTLKTVQRLREYAEANP